MDYCPCCNAVCVALDDEPILTGSAIDTVVVPFIENRSRGSHDVLEGLTDDQRVVVEIDSGRHLVLAPPGTGKTEMLTRRVVRALAMGRNERRMFCGTFTIRAAVEMRDRISMVTKLSRERLPEIGNLHHFCYAFLTQHHFVSKERQIVDEIFVRDMVEDCIGEFKDKFGVVQTTEDGSSVVRIPGEYGVECDKLTQDEIKICKGYLNLCDESKLDRKPVVVKIVTGMEGMRQRQAGIPERLCEPQMVDDQCNAFIADILNRYTFIKKRLSVIDFDDLIIETYARLASGALPDGDKYDWIQVDEVQDLNPLQWKIVDMIAAPNAVIVYFGDYDQSIFSFMGASLSVLDEKVRTCIVHSFKKNFRATSYLLDMLTRYSFRVLESRFPFVPSPNVYQNASGALALTSYEYDLIYTLSQAGAKRIEYRKSREVKRSMMLNAVVGHVCEFLQEDVSGRIAVLVQTNKDADAVADRLSRYIGDGFVRFSGEEFVHLAAYRNAVALFESVSNPISRPAWSRLIYLFGGRAEVPTQRQARMLTMSLFEVGINPADLLQSSKSTFTHEQVEWINVHKKFVRKFRDSFAKYRRRFLVRIGRRSSIRKEMMLFRDLIDKMNHADEKTPLTRLEHFFAWTDKHYSADQRPFVEVLAKDWLNLSRMKEADMLTDDDRVIVSTVHKAKGLQFDTVIVPDVDEYPSYYSGRTEEGRAESARLLYVALSRAKRQLILMQGVGIDDQGRHSNALGDGAKFVQPILETFASSFADFYYRKDRLNQSLEDIGKTDWLAVQYRVAEAVRNHHTLMDIESLIHNEEPTIRRMAVLTLEWEENEWKRNSILKEVLGGCDYKAINNAISVISRIQCIGLVKDLRSLMTRLDQDHQDIKLEILAAYESMPDSPKIRELIGDSIYDVDGGIRREAVRILCERGISKWNKVISGDDGDWDRMINVSDTEHDSILAWMVSHKCPFVCQSLLAMVMRRNTSKG